MKTESDAIHPITPEEIIARVDELKPKFLEGLAPEEVVVIVGAATLRRIQARTVVTKEGHDAEKLFLFIEGRGRTFAMTSGGEKVILLKFFGEIVGEGNTESSEVSGEDTETNSGADSTVLQWSQSSLSAIPHEVPQSVGKWTDDCVGLPGVVPGFADCSES